MGELADKVAGKAKEVAGKVTGDSAMEGEGDVQQTKGKAEGLVNRASDKAGSMANDTKKDADRV